MPAVLAPALAVPAMLLPSPLCMPLWLWDEDLPGLAGRPAGAALPACPVVVVVVVTTDMQYFTVPTTPPYSFIRALKAVEEYFFDSGVEGVVVVFGAPWPARNAVHRPNWALLLAGPVVGMPELVFWCTLLDTAAGLVLEGLDVLDVLDVELVVVAWEREARLTCCGRVPLRAAAAVPTPRAAIVAAAANFADTNLASMDFLLASLWGNPVTEVTATAPAATIDASLANSPGLAGRVAVRTIAARWA